MNWQKRKPSTGQYQCYLLIKRYQTILPFQLYSCDFLWGPPWDWMELSSTMLRLSSANKPERKHMKTLILPMPLSVVPLSFPPLLQQTDANRNSGQLDTIGFTKFLPTLEWLATCKESTSNKLEYFLILHTAWFFKTGRKLKRAMQHLQQADPNIMVGRYSFHIHWLKRVSKVTRMSNANLQTRDLNGLKELAACQHLLALN